MWIFLFVSMKNIFDKLKFILIEKLLKIVEFYYINYRLYIKIILLTISAFCDRIELCLKTFF